MGTRRLAIVCVFQKLSIGWGVYMLEAVGGLVRYLLALQELAIYLTGRTGTASTVRGITTGVSSHTRSMLTFIQGRETDS
jgi:hypothetical protein